MIHTMSADFQIEHPMKRSFVMETFVNQNSSLQNRQSVLKKSSLTLNHSQNSIGSQNSRTPRSKPPVHLQNYSNSHSNSYFHQSNYGNLKYQVPQIPLQQISTNKIEAFSLEQKKYKQPTLEQIIKQLSQKLEKTISHVQRHQILLKNHQNILGSYNLHHKSLGKIIVETVNEQIKAKEIQLNMNNNTIKTEIQNIKYQVKKYMQKTEVDDKKIYINQNINKSIENVSKDLITHLNEMIDNQTKCQKKQIDKMKEYLQLQFSNAEKNMEEKIKKNKIQQETLHDNKTIDTIVSCRGFLGDPLLVKYITKVAISLKSQTKQLQQSEIVYKIDNDGYLLDGEGKYILNAQYQQMKLSPQQIEMIRIHGFIR